MDAPCDAVVVFYLRDGQISGLSYLFGDGPHWEQADLVHVIREGAESEDREPAIVLGVGASRQEARHHFQEYWQRLKRIHTRDCEAGEVFGHSIAEVEARSQIPIVDTDGSDTDFSGAEDHPVVIRQKKRK